MMKKHGKIAAVLSVCILALAGCGNGETAETAADTAAELTEITEEQTSAETTEAEETDTEAETSEETTAAAETSEAAEEILDGDYYECCFDDYIVAYSEESFIRKGGTQEMIDAAIAAVLKTDNFKDAYAEMKDNPDGRYNWLIDEYSYIFDQNGVPGAVFYSGFCDDFDGDGKKEAFIICDSVGHTDGATSALPYDTIDYAVFVSSDGTAEIVYYGTGGTCAALRYNGFIHMTTHFGANISTTISEIYALEDGKPVKKYEGYNIYGLSHGFIIEEIIAQAPAPRYIFWDNSAHEYRCASNYGLGSVSVDSENVCVELDLDAAAGSIVPLKIDALTDDDVSEMVLAKHKIFYRTDAEIAEIIREDYDGDGVDEIIARTSYLSGNDNTDKRSTAWAVVGRTCEELSYSFPENENSVFTVSIGNNKVFCIVRNFDSEKTYQSVDCYTVINGGVREVRAGSGYKIVTDMTSLWLQNNTDENDVQPVQSVEEVFGEQDEQALYGNIVLK